MGFLVENAAYWIVMAGIDNRNGVVCAVTHLV